MKITGRETLWEGKFLRTVLIKYSDLRADSGPAGTTETVRDWEAFERVNCDGIVGIVPFTENSEVILIRQFRPPINGNVIELPAGLCDYGESLKDAAERELLEETGYSAGRMDFLIKGPMSSGASSEMLNVYVATGLTFVGIGKRDETENIEVLKIPLDKLNYRLLELLEDGNFIDLKILGLVEMAKKVIS